MYWIHAVACPKPWPVYLLPQQLCDVHEYALRSATTAPIAMVLPSYDVGMVELIPTAVDISV